MGMTGQENKEIATNVNDNTDEENIGREKKRKKAKVIISVFLVAGLVGMVIYNLLLSRVDEVIYYTLYNREEGISTMYCYDASGSRSIVAEIEGDVTGGVADPERGRFVLWRINLEDDIRELVGYYMESGQMEIYFDWNQIHEITGLNTETVIFDRTDKSCVYLRLYEIVDDEKKMYMGKYVLETGEITDIQEIDRRYTSVCNGNFYVTGMGYYPGFQDITTDGKGVLICEEGDHGTKYLINDLETGENTVVASLPDTEIYNLKLYRYEQMHFIGESNNCVYVKSILTIFDTYIERSIWIKEPGHIARKIFSFDFLAPSEDIVIMY